MNSRPLYTEHWQDSSGRAKDLGLVWTLHKNGREASCVLQGHPIGTEARIVVDGDVRRTEAFRTSAEMVNTTAEWRAAYEAKGWQTKQWSDSQEARKP